MIRTVTIKGIKHTISQSNVLGSGGEAVVVQVDKMAVKIYHDKQQNIERAQKLESFFRFKFVLPTTICSPRSLVFDSQNKLVVGYTMPMLPKRAEVVQRLSTKSYRRANPKCNSQFVTDLFINAHATVCQLHQAGIVIGDFNDLNALFYSTKMLFIDVDSFQFHNHPCMVGTENFLDPKLYNVNLAKKPVFRPEHDWYAFMVMFVKSLLLTHPYGGVQKGYNTILQRALAKKPVFEPDVRYPKMAYSYDLLNTSLQEANHRMFKEGERFVVNVDMLREFRESLVTCNSCGIQHPAERSSCPQCATINTQQIQRKVKVVKSKGKKTVIAEELLTTSGNFIWHKIYDRNIYAIAVENNLYVLYVHKPDGGVRRLELFSFRGFMARFEMFGGKYLVMAQEPATDSEILIIDILGQKPNIIDKRQTSSFDGSRTFTCTRDHLYRADNGILYRGHVDSRINSYTEISVGNVMKNQAWIAGSPINETVFGYQRFFNNLKFFLISGNFFDIDMPELDDNESILDVSIEFAATSLLFMMKTEIKGTTFTRVFVVDFFGKVISNYRLQSLPSDTHRNIHGKAFAKPSDTCGMVLHPTDDGIVQGTLETTKVTQEVLLSESEQFISDEDNISLYRKGILVASDQLLSYLTLK